MFVRYFRTPAPDFELSSLQLAKGQSFNIISRSAEIFLVFTGAAEITEEGGNSFKRNKGEAWVSFDAAAFRIVALEDAILYQASIPGLTAGS